MLSLQVRWDDFTDIQEMLERLANFNLDMKPLGDLIAQQIFEENREARLAGLDKSGGYLIDVSAETLKRRGPGLPFVPHGDASRVITNLAVEVSPAGNNQIQVRAYWTGIPWLRYHATGTARLPMRDIMGLDPDTERWISDVFSEHIRLRVQEILAGRQPDSSSVADLPLRRPAR
jgi:hypothetical protein